MSERLVHCRMLGKELPGLKKPPYKNEIGKRLYEEVSEEAWRAWLQESVRIINTYRIDLGTAEGQSFMLDQTSRHFGFEEGGVVETAWTPPGRAGGQ